MNKKTNHFNRDNNDDHFCISKVENFSNGEEIKAEKSLKLGVEFAMVKVKMDALSFIFDGN